ncbi:MAG: GNAT family N-acetyltransferase [Dehalococcoidia bacterium]|nr:GNAT family N-acetyltransferase [Dehalococcoidia bacterium]
MPQRPIEARRTVGASHRTPDAATRAGVRIREATPGDVPALVTLINAAYKPVDWWLFEQLRTDGEELLDALADPDGTLIVAEMDGALAGHLALWLRPDEAHFGLLATGPAFQGRGIAPLLIAEAERRARDAGYHALGLGCIRENGLPAYYESLGYRVTQESPSRLWDARQEFTYVEMAKDL